MRKQIEHDARLLGGQSHRTFRCQSARGVQLEHLEPSDLETIDEFHIRGRLAPLDLAERLNIAPGFHILDVGSGLGGPARTIAKVFNCRVTGIDLTSDFCDAAREMSRWVGLSDIVTFRQGDAAALDFPTAAFDTAVSIHAAMNIARKDAMLAGIRKALKPGGYLGIYDVIQGEGGTPHYPVPWALDPSISHLVTSSEMRDLLNGAGFTVEQENDSTEDSARWFSERLKRVRAAGTPRLGFHLFLGAVHADMMKNQVRNLMERRIRTVAYIARLRT